MNLTDIKLIWRNLRKHSSFALINTFGLSVSIAVALLITLYLQFEFGFDRSQPKSDSTYRLLTTFKYPNSPETTTSLSSVMMGPYLKRQCVEIDDFLRVVNVDNNVLCRANDKEFSIGKILQVDSTFFDFFDHHLIAGNPGLLFNRPGNIILTKPVSDALFDSVDPIDKTINHTYTLSSGMDTTIYYQVAGVMDVLPVNSHLQYDALTVIDDREFADWEDGQKWHGVMANTYFHLNSGVTDPGQAENRFAPALEKEMPNSDMIGLSLQAFRDIHTGSSDIAFDFNNYLKSNKKYLMILALIGLFILIIGAVNFANLSTVLSLKRSQEVGVRKTLGATKANLVWQFLRESLLMTFIAGGLALIWVEAFKGPFLDMLGRDIKIDLNLPLFSTFLLLLVFIGLLAGIYPALQASRSSTSEVFQNSKVFTSFKRPFVQYLVILQFVLSGVLIIGSIISYQQVSFLKNKNLGFQYDQVMEMEIGAENWMHSASFKRELEKIPGVKAVSGSDYSLGTIDSQNGVMVRNEETGKWENYPMSILRADPDFFDLFEMEFARGRAPTPQGANDEVEYVVNESFIKKIGWKQDPLGQEIIRAGLPFENSGKIVGVIKDVHHNTLRHAIEPICFQASDISSVIAVKLASANIETILTNIQKIWNTQIKDRPLEYRFMDDHFDQVYASESRLGQALLLATVLSIIIASLGLLALSAFVISQRTREIGIRKVLGASITSVIGLLSKDFLRLVFIALLIASPVAWFLMEKWLQDFAYRIEISWMVFMLAGVLGFLTAFLTVGIQGLRAALSNPVESLRNN